jgi:hypothetical protein
MAVLANLRKERNMTSIQPIGTIVRVIAGQEVTVKVYPCQYQPLPARQAVPRNEAASRANAEAYSFFLETLA